MRRDWLPSILLAIVALVVAWYLVGWLWVAVRFVLRLTVVLVVAVIVYVAVSSWLKRTDADR